MVGSERVQDIVASPAVLGVDAEAAPQKVAAVAARDGVVTGAAVEAVAAVWTAGEGIVAVPAPDDRPSSPAFRMSFPRPPRRWSKPAPPSAVSLPAPE